MKSQVGVGGAGLRPTVFTFTAAMRAALSGNVVDRAFQVRSYCKDFIRPVDLPKSIGYRGVQPR